MSRLIKAISELLQSPQGSPRRGKNPEPFSRSEFKKLIQQELAPAKDLEFPLGSGIPFGISPGIHFGISQRINFGIWNPL
ncbi:hypothetical protein TURU_126707 [Turdus rufiventris]|nr:hypothetical protein TURU_126707 [Turdus rufiventris]